ncbi:MAG: methyltransferase domain-containing protein [Alphaproteobacteria bacterium]
MTPQPDPHWDPQLYARSARFVSELAVPLLEHLDLREGLSVLDLGCGDGALTARIAASGARVIGVDTSAEQVAAACARGLDARVVDGEALAFEDAFDAVFSNAALHWMRRPDRVLAGVWRALKPGGRFVGEFGGAGNIATVVRAIEAALRRRGFDARRYDPWYFPTLEAYRERLTHHGFVVDDIALVPRPTRLPGPIEDWLDIFAQSFLDVLGPEARASARREIADSVRPALLGPDGVWTVDYVRLRFVATKPGSA